MSKLIKKYFKKKVDITNYDLWKDIDITEKEKHEFYDEHINELNDNTKVEWRCKYFLNQLSKYFRLYIITARHEDAKDITIKWLDEHDIPYDKIYFNSGDKLDVCKKLKVKCMIDDSPWNIRKLNKHKVNCFIFNRPYNGMVKNTDYTTRVNSWEDIYFNLIGTKG